MAELCQAQYKLELAKFWFGSVASLKFNCLVQTGVVAIVNNQISSLDKCIVFVVIVRIAICEVSHGGQQGQGGSF